jgi:uncharacterized OB-fold protein
MTSSQIVESKLEFPYRRSLGTVIGGFALGLREHKILGSRTTGGEVLVPPLEYDPNTGEPVADGLVPVGPGGEVVSWTWVSDPTDRHPLDRPFAFALIKLDGASTSLVHAVDVASPDEISTGMRVEPRWSAEPKGVITDIEAFVPEGTAPEVEIKKADSAEGDEQKADDPIVIDAMTTLIYSEPLPASTQRFAEALVKGKILGAYSKASGKTYVPTRPYDPLAGVELSEADDVEVSDKGVVTGYTIVTPVRYYGQTKTEPFIYASVLLEGTSTPLGGQEITGIPNDDVHVGLPVRAVWMPESERTTEGQSTRGWASVEGAISSFEWTGEPDVPFEQYKDWVV